MMKFILALTSFLVQSIAVFVITKMCFAITSAAAASSSAAKSSSAATASSASTASSLLTGVSYGLVHEAYDYTVISVLSNSIPSLAPDLYEIIEDFASLQNVSGFLRHKVYGWFLAPLTGKYTFTSSCNFTCQLYLSNDSNPLNKSIIITNNSVQNLTSKLVLLNESKIYYIEVILSTTSPKATYHLSIGVVYSAGITTETFQFIPSNLLGLIWTETGNASFTTNSIKECVFNNGLFVTCVCKNGQKILNNIIACQDGIEIVQNSLLMEDEVPLARNTYVTTLKSLNKEYSVLFEVKPNAFDRNWRSVIHLLISNSSSTQNSVAGVYFAPNGSLYVTSTLNGSFHSFYYSMLLHLKTWSVVNIRQELCINTYHYYISVNGTLIYSTANANPVEVSDVKVYAANPWNVSQNGFIRNLIIISETFDAMFMGCETALIKGYFSTTLNVFFEEYAILFDLKLSSYLSGSQNVIHLTPSGSTKHEDSNPYVDFNSLGFGNIGAGALEFNFAINNTVAKKYYSKTNIPLARWVAIKLSQRLFNGTYKYTVNVNQIAEYSTVIARPIKLYNAIVYTSDPFAVAQPGFIRNLNVVSRSLGVWTQWASWSNCSVICANCTKNRTRTCIINIIGGDCLGNKTEFDICFGVWMQWSSWSQCALSCGASIMNRFRVCNNTINLYKCYGNNNETMPCTSYTNCSGVWTQWSTWSACLSSCGISLMNRSRICNTSNIWIDCFGNNNETASCISNITCLGIWTQWSNWSECLPSCGVSLMNRSRICNTTNTWSDCFGNVTETASCISNITCLDAWAQWSIWSECQPSCGISLMSRLRICDTINTWFDCSGNITETASCISNITCLVNLAFWTLWSDWSECTSCVNEVSRLRICNSTSYLLDCRGNSTEARSCINNTTCLAYWADWNNWSECMPSCGASIMNRSRDCNNKSVLSSCYGNNTEILPCFSVLACVGEWNLWSECSQTCGLGLKKSFLRSYVDMQYYKTESCFLRNCTDDAVWGTWENFGQCSRTCGGGVAARSRLCKNDSSDNQICFGLSQDVCSCNDFICPVNGEWTNWSEWSLCSQPCNVGESKRVRDCSQPKPQFNGNNCVGGGQETTNCSFRNCESVSATIGVIFKDEIYSNQYSDLNSLASQKLKGKINSSMRNMYNAHKSNVTFEIVIHSIKVVYP